MRTLTTVSEVLDALGGNAEVQRLLEVNGPNVVANWRYRQRLPTRTYFRLRDALRRKRLSAPRSLWGFDE